MLMKRCGSRCLSNFQQLFMLQAASGTHAESGLDDLPGFEEVVDVLDVQFNHAGALARDDPDQAVALQMPKLLDNSRGFLGI
jgi:hypothetical protein